MRLSLFLVTMTLSALTLSACGNSGESTEAQANQSTNNTADASNTNNASSDKKNTLSVTGAGASFPSLIYAKWSKDYNQTMGGNVSYESVGSLNGVKKITNGSVDFGASDVPLKVDELKNKGLMQFPTVIGGVTPIVNIEGIEAGKMVLDGKTLAKIYQGNITKWNDPEIVSLNPELSLPDSKIKTVYRSDGSGTTYNFTHFLNSVYPSWGAVDKVVEWPTSKLGTAVGAVKSEGVAETVANTENSIGYIDFSYAKKNQLVYTSMVNASGKVVQPSHNSFSAAGDVNWDSTPGFYKFITNSNNPNAWPIATTTFVIVNMTPENPEQVIAVLEFFNWAYMEGYQSALDLDFVPFSDKPVATFLNEWKKIVDKEGNPIYQIKSEI